MVFSSSVFLFAFLPVFLVLYFVIPWRAARNVWLLAASLVFYAWGEPVYVWLMVASILANWLFGLAIGRLRPSEAGANSATGGAGANSATGGARATDAPSATDAFGAPEGERAAGAPDSPSAPSGKKPARPPQAKALLVGAVVFNCLVIGFFKYEGFLAANVNALVGASVVPDLLLPLPIGISFYTLQALSYVIDVYRGEVAPQRNLLYLGMYVACFPQLIAGPIVRYQTIQDQVVGRRETLADFAGGFRLFIIGLAKKALLANTMALLATEMLSQGGPSIGAVGAWAGLLAYTFQIFFDFSGYSDMAIGLGRMMGFEYLRNFNYPYIARSVTEFWRRWHISLSTFFRDYVYIPLGGSRCSKARNALNIAVVWAITGLWHGAAWNYVGWGVYYGVLLIGEKFLWGRVLAKAPAFVGNLYTIAVFVFGWSFFWITDAGALVSFWQAMVGCFGATGDSTYWALTAWEYLPVFVVCILASTPVCPFAKERFLAWVEKRPPVKVCDEGIANPRRFETTALVAFDAYPATPGRRRAYRVASCARDLVLIALLFASCASVVAGSFNPFIYFQF